MGVLDVPAVSRAEGDARYSALPVETYVRAGEFTAGQGSPVLGTFQSRFPTWTLRDGNSDRVNATVYPPSRSYLVDVDVLWVKGNTSNIGDVVFRLGWVAATAGDGPNVTYAPNAVAYADVQIGEIRRTRLGSGLDITNAMSALLMIERLGGDAADTLVSDIYLVGAIVSPTPKYSVLSEDGGWYTHNEHWLIADPDGRLAICGLITSNGDAAISSLNVDTGVKAQFTLKPRFQLDDHAVPQPVVMPDGRIIAFYARHSIVEDPIYLRRTTNPHDITAWDAEQTIVLPTGGQPCYPKPAVIGSRLYVFFRNTTNHDYIYSDDNGATWSAPARLFSYSPGWRGYVNYHASLDGRVDFTSTDDNPNPTGSYSNIYHCYLQGGTLYKSDGTLIAALGAGGITPAQMTKVYNYTEAGDAWAYDVQRDGQGRPLVVFASFPTLTNHFYWYARWDGTTWRKYQFTTAGASPYDIDGTGRVSGSSGEPRYSGGLHMHPADPAVVFLSRWVDGQLEIERWQTPDGGVTWSSRPVTRRSLVKNMRPTTLNRPMTGAPDVFWMAGWYAKFTRYQTRAVYGS